MLQEPSQNPQLFAGTTVTSASGASYTIRQFVGSESTGEIYLAHADTGGTAVFVHLFDAQLLAGKRGQVIRRALERGFERAAGFVHTAMLEVIDRIVWNGDSLHGVVTRYSDGPHLSDYIEEYGALPVDVVISLFVELVDCLAVLHQSGHAHGTLNPNAVRVELVAERMTPRLEGLHLEPLVAHIAELGDEVAAFRPTQRAPGTHGAMLDDIYAVGAMLAFTLTGVAPDAPDFEASLERAEGLPHSMRSMLTQCLQQDPGRRFQSVVAVRNVLRVLTDELEEARRRSPERPEPGDVVAGQYAIERLLGEGGMARVYLARDQTLGTQVALKLLNASCLEEAQVVERFLQEASIQARLVHPEPHPNIVAVHRVLRDTPVGYVMEFVEGETLEDVVLERRLSERALIDIFIQIADGLHHAHENRIVHRDLKPSNILLVSDGQGGWLAKLMDFGISKQLDQPRTRTNLVLGTLGYISPELFISAKDASPASDLYALGCTMFEALTGDVPFSVNGGMRQLAFRVYNEAAPTPRSRGVEISDELEAVIMMMLAKKPEARPPSAAWVRDRLQTIAAGARDEALSAVVAAHRDSLGDTAAVDAPFSKTTQRTRLEGKTTQRSSSDGSPQPRPPSHARSRIIALVALALIGVIGGIVAAVLLSGGDDGEPTGTAEVEETAPPVEEPAPPVEAVAPEEPPEPGRTTLPASRVVGAAELLAQARARAEAGDKRAALELYEQAVATYDTQDEAPDTREQADALIEMAQLYEAVAEEEVTGTEGDAEPAEGVTVESASLLAAASSAYGRAGELTQDYTMFLQKAEVDQQRGDASGALEALRAAAEMTDDEDVREETEKQAERLERAYAEGAEEDDEDDERTTRGVPVGPLPPNMIELWIETRPDRATVYLGKRRLGRTPLIKRLPKAPGTLEIVLKASGRYTERLQIDGGRGGRFEVPMAFKPQKIK